MSGGRKGQPSVSTASPASTARRSGNVPAREVHCRRARMAAQPGGIRRVLGDNHPGRDDEAAGCSAPQFRPRAVLRGRPIDLVQLWATWGEAHGSRT
jgi:hypothetical protein